MKLLVSDYDYTMYDGINPECIKENIKSINDFMNNGNMFVIATGRAFNEFKERAIEDSIPYNYLICQSGSSIFDDKDRLLYFTPLNEQFIFKILNYLNKQSSIKEIRQVNFYGDDTIKEYETTEIYCRLAKTEENIKEAKKILNESKSFGILVFSFTTPDYIYIVYKEHMNKAKGIYYLLNKIHVPKESVYTIGDEENDIEMIKEFKGFRVSNASELLKSEDVPEIESVRKLIKRIESE